MKASALTKAGRLRRKRPGAFHHGDLEEALVEAAIRAVHARGAPSVSVRRLAQSLGVSDAAVYRHFRDRDALLEAVGRRGVVACMQTISDAMEGQASPRGTLEAAGRAYVDFAVANANWFRLYFSRGYMDGGGSRSEDDTALAAAGLEVEGNLKATLGRIVPADTVDDAFLALWSHVHGLAGLVIERGLRRAETDEARLAAAHRTLGFFVDRLIGSP
jgi:AcrR family transcriptional regulator